MSEAQETKVELSPEEQREQAIKVAVGHQKALANLVILDIRNYLQILLKSGISYNEKTQTIQSLERAVIAGLDYGVDVMNIGLQQSGKFAKMENSFAAHLARLRDNGMLILADKMDKQQTQENVTNE